MYLCKYKNLLGKPKEGVHKYRIFNIAIVDLILTILLSLVISKIFKIKFLISFIGIFIFGEFLHYLFCVDTTIIKVFK
jgi:hypothetical protein